MKSGMDVILDLQKLPELPADEEIPPSTQPKKKKRNGRSIAQGGVAGIDVGYKKLATHLERSLSLLAPGQQISCAVCDQSIDSKPALVLICPEQECRAASHLNCLAQHFLREEAGESLVLPISGRCPRCQSMLRWIDLVKELSLRLCGEAQVAKLMKKPKTRAKKASRGDENVFSTFEENLINDANCLDHVQSGSDDESSTRSTTSEEQLMDDWYYQQDDDDTMSVTSNASGVSSCLDCPSPTKPQGSARNLGILVEDSEWDDAEVLD